MKSYKRLGLFALCGLVLFAWGAIVLLTGKDHVTGHDKQESNVVLTHFINVPPQYKVAEADVPASRGIIVERVPAVVKTKIIATAYCNCEICCDNELGITASGRKTAWGTIAVPKDIPFGTKLELKGWGTFTAWDRGGAIQRLEENIIKIDVWFPTHQEALNFGVRKFESVLIYP